MTIGEREPSTSPAALDTNELSAAKTTGAKVLAGGFWTMLARVLPQVYVLAQSIMLARFFSVSEMGRQSFIAFIELSLIPVFSFGMSAGLVRFAADAIGRGEGGEVRGLTLYCLRYHIVGAILGAGVLIGIGYTRSDLRTAWILAGVACGLGVLTGIPEALLSSLQRWRDSSVVTLVVGALTTVSTTVVLILGGTIASVFAVNVAMSVIALVAMTLIARRAMIAPDPDPHSWEYLKAPLIRYASLVWVGFFLTLIVWRRSEFFFLERYASDQQLAFYSVAFAASAGLAASIDSVSGVVAPTVATLQGSGDVLRLRSGFARAVRLVVLASVPLAAGGIALGPAAIEAVYGTKYSFTAAPLRIMLVVFPVVALMSMCSGILWGLGKARAWLLAFVFASVVDIALDLLIIPGHGATGAAVANSSAQLAASIPIFLYSVKLLGKGDWHVNVLARASMTSVVAALVAWGSTLVVTGALGVVVGLALGGVTFVVLAPIVGVLPAIDAEWIETTLGRRLGGLVGRACRASSVP